MKLLHHQIPLIKHCL